MISSCWRCLFDFYDLILILSWCLTEYWNFIWVRNWIQEHWLLLIWLFFDWHLLHWRFLLHFIIFSATIVQLLWNPTKQVTVSDAVFTRKIGIVRSLLVFGVVYIANNITQLLSILFKNSFFTSSGALNCWLNIEFRLQWRH